LSRYDIGSICLSAPSNRFDDLRPFVPDIEDVLGCGASFDLKFVTTGAD